MTEREEIEEAFKRCAICGFIVDMNYAAEKPTIDHGPSRGGNRHETARDTAMELETERQMRELDRNIISRLQDEIVALKRERDEAYNAGLEMGARVSDHAGSWRIATAIRASKRDHAESAIRERDAAQEALQVMHEALEPFADLGFDDPSWSDEDEVQIISEDGFLLDLIKVRTFRRARSALAQNKEEGR